MPPNRSRRSTSPGRAASPARVAPSAAPSARATTPARQQRPTVLALVLILLSLQAVTLLFVLEFVPSLKESPLSVASVGVASLVGIAAGARYAFTYCGCQFSLSAIFFAVVCWSAAIDLLLALALRGTTVLGKFYVSTGEEYFKSSWGFFALLWDGTAHYAMQLFLAHATLLGRPRRAVGLAWAGSIINSMPVLLLGGATGIFSSHIKPATALNAPYVLVPIAYLAALIRDEGVSGKATASGGGGGARTRVAPMTTFEAFVWATAHVSAILVHAWRAIVVLGSQAPLALWWLLHVDPILGETARPSHGFVRVQCLVFFFYYIPYHAWALADLLFGRQRHRRNRSTWAVIVAGGYAQAQATYMGAAALRWVGFAPLVAYPLPMYGRLLGLGLATFPTMWAVRCCK